MCATYDQMGHFNVGPPYNIQTSCYPKVFFQSNEMDKVESKKTDWNVS